MEKVRKSFDPSFNPGLEWTARPDVHMRGLPKQLVQPNFLHSCVNLRWAKFCERFGLDPTTAIPPSRLQVDVRQQVNRQPKSGHAALLSGSVLYWPRADRTLMGLEHLFHLGWCEDITLNGIDDKQDPMPQILAGLEGSSITAPKAKRCRRNSGPHPHDSTAIDLAGNGMCLPDLMTFLYAGTLASEDTHFQFLPPAIAVGVGANVANPGVHIMEAHEDFAGFYNQCQRMDGGLSDDEDN